MQMQSNKLIKRIWNICSRKLRMFRHTSRTVTKTEALYKVLGQLWDDTAIMRTAHVLPCPEPFPPLLILDIRTCAIWAPFVSPNCRPAQKGNIRTQLTPREKHLPGYVRNNIFISATVRISSLLASSTPCTHKSGHWIIDIVRPSIHGCQNSRADPCQLPRLIKWVLNAYV